MSRLPTLAGPTRSTHPSPQSGIPTPATRRPRASLGPTASPQLAANKHDPEMDQALKDVLRHRRPPSSLGRSSVDDPETPPQSNANNPSIHLSSSTSNLPGPRTPSYRPRTPSSISSSSRPSSRPSIARGPLASSTNGATSTAPLGRPRSSLAASAHNNSAVPATPSFRRPESRAGLSDSISSRWTPQVGDRVRLPTHGFEGILRYLGPTHIRDGNWAGVELQGGFQGKGRNDGSVDGVRYFECGPNCGIFTLADKLAPPTSMMGSHSRPASVASQRSLTSSYSAASGRQTPSGRATPSHDRIRKGATTPSFGTRSVSSRTRVTGDDDIPATPGTARKTLLGNSTASNAARIEAKITAGSRASKYIGVTAKQLEARAAEVVVPPVGSTTPLGTPAKSGTSTATTTPKASRITAIPGSTPRSRPSLGLPLSTPKARTTPRHSEMPPPPSPQGLRPPLTPTSATTSNFDTTALEEELEQLRQRNADLEDQLAASATAAESASAARQANTSEIEQLRKDMDEAKAEADDLRTQLAASTEQSSGDRQRAEELTTSGSKLQEELDAKVKEIEELRREMELAAERASGELEAGIEARREEVRVVEERAESAEMEATEMKRLVDELTQAGNQLIELNEGKQFEFECKIRELEEKLSAAAEETAKVRKEASANGTPEPKRDLTATEIDNETLNDQVKHMQNRISSLEEQLDESRGQAETDSEAWQAKYAKARESEKAMMEELSKAKERISRLKDEGVSSSERVADLQGALKENATALETARAEIESLRIEAAEAESLRTTLSSQPDIGELQTRIKELTVSSARASELEAKVSSLEAELTSLKSRENETPSPEDTTARARRSTSAGSSPIEDAEKSIRGYRHIVQEMQTENAQLKNREIDLLDEINMLKEEIKLLQDISEAGGAAGSPKGAELGGASQKQLNEARATIAQQAETIKELEREVSELESLVESKIYREDELETHLQDLNREVAKWKSQVGTEGAASSLTSASATHSRNSSAATGASVVTDATQTTSPPSPTANGRDSRCELCEGPHDLDACPVFSGTTLELNGRSSGSISLGANGDKANAAGVGLGLAHKKKWCDDCESEAHSTAECPMADDVF